VVTALAAADATAAGPLVAVAWSDGALHLWDLLNARMRPLVAPHRADTLALSPEGVLYAAGRTGTTALRLDLAGLFG
jgi:hypothetical protein